MVPFSRYLAYVVILCGGLAADLATKHWMFERLGTETDSKVWWIWKGYFGFQTTYNEGALFGMGQGFWAVFAALSVAAALGILIWLFAFGAAKDWWLLVSLSIVSAGILGNLYDRLGLPGLVWRESYGNHRTGETVHAVRDFILMAYGDWRWPNYNIADSLLVCGAAMLVLHSFWVKPCEELEKTETADGGTQN